MWRIATSTGRRDRDLVQGSVDTFVVLSARHLHCEGPFGPGSIASVVADVELDLGAATAAGPVIELSATTILADLDVVVPAGWRVRVDGPVILADVKVPEDLPAPEAGAGSGVEGGPPQLVIRAFSLLSDLTIGFRSSVFGHRSSVIGHRCRLDPLSSGGERRRADRAGGNGPSEVFALTAKGMPGSSRRGGAFAHRPVMGEMVGDGVEIAEGQPNLAGERGCDLDEASAGADEDGAV